MKSSEMLIWWGQETDDKIRGDVLDPVLTWAAWLSSVLSKCFSCYLCSTIMFHWSFYLQPSLFITPLHHLSQSCRPVLNETQQWAVNQVYVYHKPGCWLQNSPDQKTRQNFVISSSRRETLSPDAFWHLCDNSRWRLRRCPAPWLVIDIWWLKRLLQVSSRFLSLSSGMVFHLLYKWWEGTVKTSQQIADCTRVL